MFIKNLLIAAVLIFNGTGLIYSQDSEDIVHIEILAEAPKDLSILALQIPVWHITASMVNFSLYDLKTSLSYVGKGKVNGGIDYTYKLGDQVLPQTYEGGGDVSHNMVMSIYEPGKAQSLDVWGTYYFKEKIEVVNETIRLKSVGRTNYITSVKTDQLRKVGLNLGYSQGFTWYNMNGVDLEVSPVTAPSVTNTVDYSSMSTIQDYKIIKAGITYSKAINLKVKVLEYGIRKSQWVSVNTFNLMYAVTNKFDNVYVGSPNTQNNTLELIESTITENNTKLPIGFEFKHKNYSKGWFAYEWGVHYAPGLLSKINFGATIGVSVNIDFLRKNSF